MYLEQGHMSILSSFAVSYKIKAAFRFGTWPKLYQGKRYRMYRQNNVLIRVLILAGEIRCNWPRQESKMFFFKVDIRRGQWKESSRCLYWPWLLYHVTELAVKSGLYYVKEEQSPKKPDYLLFYIESRFSILLICWQLLGPEAPSLKMGSVCFCFVLFCLFVCLFVLCGFFFGLPILHFGRWLVRGLMIRSLLSGGLSA